MTVVGSFEPARRRLRRIADLTELDGGDRLDACQRAHTLGFEAVLLGPWFPSAVATRAASVESATLETLRTDGLAVLVDVDLRCLDASESIVRDHPAWFRAALTDPDPRAATRVPDYGPVFTRGPLSAELLSWWETRLAALLDSGVAGFRALHTKGELVTAWTALLTRLRASHASAWVVADTLGAHADQLRGAEGAGFDAVVSSLAWWDGRAAWYFDEVRRLKALAPAVVAWLGDVVPPFSPALAAAYNDGLVAKVPRQTDPAWDALAQANSALARRPTTSRTVRPLLRATPGLCALWIRQDPRQEIVLANVSVDHIVSVRLDALASDAGIARSSLRLDSETTGDSVTLSPGQALTLNVAATPPRPVARAPSTPNRADAMEARLVIEAISPQLEHGRFAVKRCAGERVSVTADIYSDGHDRLAAAVVWRRSDEKQWHHDAMRLIENDRWQGEFSVGDVGRYEFAIEAWKDEFASLRDEIEKKQRAGVVEAVDVQDGRRFIDGVRKRARSAAASLKAVLRMFDEQADDAGRARVLLGADTAQAMATAGERPFLSRSRAFPIEVERLGARYASWYELFPRSYGVNGSHGTFDDVIARLPVIQAMGFDVIYLPPIHPIGQRHRKGRNNSLDAASDDPGSPYAIGAADGGHLAVHEALGGLAGFRRLLAAAADAHLEIAIDFAIQASPDHPWLREQPGWFTTRSDGTIRYAENPPKKYQDIVNVDFYADTAIPALWKALRDVVAYWATEGVRLFRVDNPHTKPFPFWEWLIADVRTRYPDVIFLAEAFTRPKPMYRLGKLGFSQSYTYFTWRNTKAEIVSYLEELNRGEARECMRPHFFVNTPDINPYFLQQGGRPAHLIRAALATTLSGLWGMYSGFELCEAAALPGREEYADSEKYQLKARDWQQPGHIIEEITRLNALRSTNPELQTHLDVEFLPADNEAVVFFAKGHPSARNAVFVAISVDPAQPHSATVELPLWRWGLADDAVVEVEDLWTGERYAWHGKRHEVALSLQRPFAIWRIAAPSPVSAGDPA